jgi:hypothetical protein
MSGWRMSGKDRFLVVLSHILPREIRERIFDPALDDVWMREASDPSRRHRMFDRVVLVLECARLGATHLVWQRRRPTRLVLAASAAIALATLLIARINYRR